jgi:peptidyl-prolyl cis-trans isomerase A (cyclophilin A)/peptidyl-prolyl cis-trans isomerase B (cyclophilin B)
MKKDRSMLATRRHLLKFISGILLASSVLTVQAADKTEKIDKAANPHVLLKTSMGDIVLELNTEKAPQTVENFLQYVKSGHYSGTIFHRVIENFMIQGGGFDKDMTQKPTRAPIENEAKNGLKNEAYTIAMARTGAPHSATAQFFINTKDNEFLNYPGQDGWGYCVFGKVIKGKEVVDKIKTVPTGNKGPHQNVPTTPVVIESASIVK